MAKMVKRLTAKNGVQYGINVAPQYSFEDDGNNFRGFVFKDATTGFELPITQCYCKNDNTVYICVRVDYIEGTTFTYNEWMETAEYMLCDKLNGHTGEFDIEGFVADLMKIVRRIVELNEKANNEEIDASPIIDCLNNEREQCNIFIKLAMSINAFELSDYEYHGVRDSYKYFKREIDRIDKLMVDIEMKLVSKGEMRKFVERVEKYGYVIVRKKDNFYMNCIKKYI